MVKLSAPAIYEDLNLKARGPKRLLPPETKAWRQSRILGLIQANPLTRKIGSASSFGGGYFGQQNSIAKVSYLQNKHEKQWKAHGKYLAREGAQKVNEKGIGFNQVDDSIQIAQELDTWQKAGDELLWKVIISPEQGYKLDLKEHIKEVMSQVEKDLGTKIQYVACDHYNTDQPHVHVAMRGVRDDGTMLRIDKEYLSVGIRARSKEIATRTLGLRLGKDILIRREQAICKRYVTELDREIQRRMDKYKTITFDHRPATGFKHEMELQLVGRLQYLTKIGLAEKEDAITWKISEHHIAYLKRVQLQDDIIKSQNMHIDKIIDRDLPVISNTLPNKGDKVLGRVAGMGVVEFNEDKRYLLVEGVDKQIHHIEASPAIVKLRDTQKLKDGDVIYLERREMLRQEPPKVTKWALNNAGLDGEKVFETLVTRGVLELRSAGEAEMMQNVDITTRAVKALFPDEGEKIIQVLEDGKKAKYFHINVVESFEDLRHHKGAHDIDRYILDIIEKTKDVPRPTIDDSVVRRQMLEIAPERIEQLKQIRVLKDDLSVDRNCFERNIAEDRARDKSLGLRLEKSRDDLELGL